jgi:hypothetical protein
MIKTLQSLHYDFIGYQHVRTWVGLTKKAKSLQMQLRTEARTEKNATKLADEWLTQFVVLQTMEWWNYF